MAGRTILGRILVAFVGVLLLAPPVAQFALAAGAPVRVASALCDEKSAPADDCDCCVGETDVARLSKCLAFCYSACILPSPPGTALTSLDRWAGRLPGCKSRQRFAPPDPGPPKPTVFL